MNNLKIISLGGFGSVTANMFVYETDKEILLVDCGLGFPEDEMLGVDLVIPDIDYLKDKKSKIKGLIISHGHEDHLGGLPYLLPQLPNIPVYAPRWANAIAKNKLKEFGLKVPLNEYNEKTRVKLGQFDLEFIPVTHSIPDTYHLIINTPAGLFYHAADFKLDLKPVMGKKTDQKRIKQVGQKGVLCLLSDCLRAELPGFTAPEAKLTEVFAREIKNCQGKFFVTTFSSNISRWKQAIDVSLAQGRKIALIGRSVEQNIRIALELKYLNYPSRAFVNKKRLDHYSPKKLTFLIAGSQAQAGSSLDRLVAGELDRLAIAPDDKIVFSTDYIPGNETALYALIDDLYRLGAEVVYTDIKSDVHVSGHGHQEDLGKLMEMVGPQYLLPIGGNFRHMVAYQRLAQKRGFAKNQVLLPDNGQTLEFANYQAKFGPVVKTKVVMVDALGVGDVGNVVLRDRKILAQEGMVVVIVTLDQATKQTVGEPEIISRGFVYVKESQPLIEGAKQDILKTLRKTRQTRNIRILRSRIQGYLEEYFFAQTGRRPMILPVIIEV